MARITTRDCERIVPNRFELVLLAAERAHQLNAGAEPLISRDGEPSTVIALREIASGRIEIDRLRDRLIGRFSRISQDIIEFGELPSGRFAPSSQPGRSHAGLFDWEAPPRAH
jgi:DNA-directed RNA polymerase subunit omega